MLRKEPTVTIAQLRVVWRRGALRFLYKRKTFTKVSAVAFDGPGQSSTVPLLVFHGRPLEFTGEVLHFHEYGTHAASAGVFRGNDFLGLDLEANWFDRGDVLVIIGYVDLPLEDSILAFRKVKDKLVV